eukprot:2843459-Pleurochrysis_carterae.AAC.2
MPYTGLTTRHTRVRPSDPAATKSHRRIDNPRRAAREASVLSEVARIVAQKTQISRTSDRPCGTEERSISSQLPLLA